jgi:hypothetical protein
VGVGGRGGWGEGGLGGRGVGGEEEGSCFERHDGEANPGRCIILGNKSLLTSFSSSYCTARKIGTHCHIVCVLQVILAHGPALFLQLPPYNA